MTVKSTSVCHVPLKCSATGTSSAFRIFIVQVSSVFRIVIEQFFPVFRIVIKQVYSVFGTEESSLAEHFKGAGHTLADLIVMAIDPGASEALKEWGIQKRRDNKVESATYVIIIICSL